MEWNKNDFSIDSLRTDDRVIIRYLVIFVISYMHYNQTVVKTNYENPNPKLVLDDSVYRRKTSADRKSGFSRYHLHIVIPLKSGTDYAPVVDRRNPTTVFSWKQLQIRIFFFFFNDHFITTNVQSDNIMTTYNKRINARYLTMYTFTYNPYVYRMRRDLARVSLWRISFFPPSEPLIIDDN